MPLNIILCFKFIRYFEMFGTSKLCRTGDDGMSRTLLANLVFIQEEEKLNVQFLSLKCGACRYYVFSLPRYLDDCAQYFYRIFRP